MASLSDPKTDSIRYDLSTSEPTKSTDIAQEQHALDNEKNASAGGTYMVTESIGADNGFKLAKDGRTVLIPQPSDDPEDPLNWSWGRKHLCLAALLLPSLLTDWGMTWGSTLFQAQAVTWHMAVPLVARSMSGGIFLQGPGGVIAVPFVQRYGRLPMLFWSQFLGAITVLIATFMPNYAGFTAFRTLQGFVATSPQVIGLSVIHDMFFFHERARKVNIWAFTFIVGPFLGPFISSFLLAKISWQLDMGILAIFYAVSTGLVVIFGEETLYDREKLTKPTSGASRISLLVGTAGFRAPGQASLITVSKHLLQLLIMPQLLLPTLYIMLLFTWAIGIVTTVTGFIRPPPYLLDDTHASLFYLAPIVGAIVGEFWGHWFNDIICKRYIKTHNGEYQPENRLWGVWIPCAFGISSMVLYGQTLQHQLPVIGLAAAWSLMTFAQVASTTAICAYALDCFPHHAALASSWINFWRTTGGFCVTYFQTQWVAKSGAAVTFGIQAAIIAFGFLFIIATQVFGRTWRERFAPPASEI